MLQEMEIISCVKVFDRSPGNIYYDKIKNLRNVTKIALYYGNKLNWEIYEKCYQNNGRRSIVLCNFKELLSKNCKE